MWIKTIGLLLLVLLCGVITYNRNRIIHGHLSLLLLFCLVLQIAMIIWFTLLERTKYRDYGFSILPFESYLSVISLDWNAWGKYIICEIIGNVMLFVPLGIIVGNSKIGRYKCILSCAIGSIIGVVIEVTQYYMQLGMFEVDDIVNNTWGALIGCTVASFLIKKDKSISAGLKTLLPLEVFIVMVGLTSLISIIKYYIMVS